MGHPVHPRGHQGEGCRAGQEIQHPWPGEELREVVGLKQEGKISKALQRDTSCGVASVEDPALLAMLKAKGEDTVSLSD